MTLKILLLISLSFILGAASCQQGVPPALNWNPKVYVGDSATQSMVRMNNGEVEQILCSDTAFNSKICMENDEIRLVTQAYQEAVLQCEVWRNGSLKHSQEIQLSELYLEIRKSQYLMRNKNESK